MWVLGIQTGVLRLAGRFFAPEPAPSSVWRGISTVARVILGFSCCSIYSKSERALMATVALSQREGNLAILLSEWISSGTP